MMVSMMSSALNDLFMNQNATQMTTFAVIATAIAALICWNTHYWDAKRRHLPPGPFNLPLVGYLPFLPTDYGSKLKQLAAKYGKIFTLRLGWTDVVFISDYEIIKKIMMQDVFNNRPKFSFFKTFLPSSLVGWNDDEWKEQRKFSLRILRYLGVGKQEVEDQILQEIHEVTSQFESANGKPVAVHRLLGSSVTNVVLLLIFGHRLDYNHPDRKMIDDSFLQRGNNVRPSMFGFMAYNPILLKVLSWIPFMDFRRRQLRVLRLVQNRIQYLKETFDTKDGDVTCFIEAYLKEMRTIRDHDDLKKTTTTTKQKYFDEEHLIGCAMSFFGAGSNTTGDFLTWFMLYMIIYPDVQAKIRKEIDDVIGETAVVSASKFRHLMPYTEAVTQELHRHANVVPSGLEHAVHQDVAISDGDYVLPSGTHIVMSSFLVHMNPEYFDEPEKFDPERFLHRNGDDDVKLIRDDKVMSFGSGKRSCPGEPIAQTEVFLYVVSILKQFELLMPEGKNYTTQGVMEFLGRIPIQPVEVIFRKRSSSSS